MKITIGVPVHNCSGFTKYLINNFVNHSYDHREHNITFVVVDNASKDEEKYVWPIFFDNSPNTTCIYEEFDQNYGCSKSFNKIYEHFDRTKGDLCILINNDIVLSKNWLNQLIKFHTENPEVGIFSPHLIDNHVAPEVVKDWFGDVRNNKGHLPKPEWQEYVDNTIKVEGTLLDVGMQGPMICVTRECRDAVGNWDEGFIKGCYDDLDYIYRARNLGFFTYVTHKCVIFHFGGSTQWYVTTYEGGNGYQQQNRKFFEKKWGVDLTGLSCSRSLMWKQPRPGENILMEFKTPK